MPWSPSRRTSSWAGGSCSGSPTRVPPEESARAATLEGKHWVTLGVIATLIISVIWFKVDVGMGAFLGASVLPALGLADHKEAIKRVPWGVIIMVCGVTVLISILEKTQGLDLFTALLARLATKDTITGVIAFVTGLISVAAARPASSCRRFCRPFRGWSSGWAGAIRSPSPRR